MFSRQTIRIHGREMKFLVQFVTVSFQYPIDTQYDVLNRVDDGGPRYFFPFLIFFLTKWEVTISFYISFWNYYVFPMECLCYYGILKTATRLLYISKVQNLYSTQLECLDDLKKNGDCDLN